MLANLHLPARSDSEQRLTQAPLGYESFEHRSEVFIWLRPGPST